MHRDSTPIAPSCPPPSHRTTFHHVDRALSPRPRPRRHPVSIRHAAVFTRRATRSGSTLLLKIARVIRRLNYQIFPQPPLRCALHSSPTRVIFLRAHQAKLQDLSATSPKWSPTATCPRGRILFSSRPNPQPVRIRCASRHCDQPSNHCAQLRFSSRGADWDKRTSA